MKVERFTLFLKRLEVETRIGIHDFERAAPQRLLISIEIELDPALVPSRDDIAATFDYDWARDLARRLAQSGHYELQETLAQAILGAILQRPEVMRVIVETAKPDVYSDAAAVGCRIEATR